MLHYLGIYGKAGVLWPASVALGNMRMSVSDVDRRVNFECRSGPKGHPSKDMCVYVSSIHSM